MKLQNVLAAIQAAPLPSRQRKSLLWQAVMESLKLAAHDCSRDEGTPPFCPNTALQSIHDECRMQGKTLGAAALNKFLKDRGDLGSGLARRVARLRKLRNLYSHPDVGLVAEIK